MNTNSKYMYLGDYVGSGSYFGACAACGRQFMSTSERIAVIGISKHCLKCAAKQEQKVAA